MTGTAAGILSVIFLFCISNTYTRSLVEELTVKTTSGYVSGGYGGKTPVGGNPIYLYRSIPFAEPPVGKLRFQPPVPVRSWEGVKDVSARGPECIQGTEDNIRGAEDCLYVKIYTTQLPAAQNKLPVVIWIYGGAFFLGAPDFDDHSPDLLLDQGVIVVALHYRVGIFGFLSTEDLVVSGNNGLRDQILALNWIKENIERFGGDPDNITVFGQSAGAASIGYILQSPQSRGLFNRVIMNSGSPLCLWSLSRSSLNMAETVASDLNIDAATTQELVDGLRTVDASELQAASINTMINKVLSVNLREGLLFGPVIEPEHEDAIITGRTHEILEEGNFQQVPIIMGYNSLEALLSEIPSALRLLLLTYDLTPSRLVPIDMNIASLITRSTIGRQIKSQYFGSQMISQADYKVMEFISDDQFTRPIQEAARLYSKKVPVYFYRFSHEGSLFGNTNRTYPGVAHTEDLGYLFDFGYEGSEEDYLTRTRMVKLWTNFIKTGNPTPNVDPLLQGVQWLPVSEDTLTYLEIDRDLEVSANPNSREFSFWRQLFERSGVPPFGTF